MHEDRVRTARELEMIANVKNICASLREVDVVIDGFSHTTFKVAKKSFVLVGGGNHDEGSLSIKADHDTQQALIKRGPYVRTPYIGQHGWVSLFGDAIIDWDEVAELVVDAYNIAAPKRLRS